MVVITPFISPAIIFVLFTVMCEAENKIRVGTVVDHRIPHKGDQTLFWDTNNWQTLCKSHHDGDKQVIEKSGEERTRFDETGRVRW